VVAVWLTLVVGDAAEAEVPVPSVTTPLRATPPGVAAVCANAGKAAAIDTSSAYRTARIMSADIASNRGPSTPERLDMRRGRNCSALESTQSQRGERAADGPPKPK
jgi:hypothetical protein